MKHLLSTLTLSGSLRSFCVTVLFFVSVLMFSACAGGAPTEGPPSVSLALSGEPSTLDPHATTETLTFQVTRSLYDTLIEPDENGRLVPALAQSWEVSEDNLSITFQIRKNVLFHNGNRLTSTDVQASLLRLQSADFASPSAGEYAVISDIIRIDDFTVRLLLSEPSAPLLYTLASGWSAILPSDLIEQGHNFAREPVGSGPFMLNEWLADEQIHLIRNPNYWKPQANSDQAQPILSEVRFQIIPERSVQVQSLVSGQVDILYIVNEEDLPILESAENISIEELDTSLVLVIAMNTSRDILAELPMRQAMNHAIDKQTALNLAYGGGSVVGTFNDTSSIFYEDFTDLYPYNPDRAGELLATVGYEPSRVFDLVLPQNFAPHVRAGELYQEMLRLAGIESQIRLVDWPTWISDVYGNANYDLTVIGHTGKLDPDGRFIGYGSGELYVRWVNEELESLINEGRRTIDIPARRAIYSEVQRIFAEEVPFVYIGTPSRRIARNSSVEGFVMTPNLETFDFRRVRRTLR